MTGLAEGNVGLAYSIAHRYARDRGLPSHLHDEVVADALLGLVLAERSYDPELGVPFAAYAAMRIKGTIIDCVRQRSPLTRQELADPDRPVRATVSLDALAEFGVTVREKSDPIGLIDDADERRDLCEQARAVPLSEGQRRAVFETLVEGRLLREVAADLGVTESWVGQLRSAGLARLREYFGVTSARATSYLKPA